MSEGEVVVHRTREVVLGDGAVKDKEVSEKAKEELTEEDKIFMELQGSPDQIKTPRLEERGILQENVVQTAQQEYVAADASKNIREEQQFAGKLKTLDDFVTSFQIVRHIGSGGICDVYQVEQKSTGAQFALKTLNPERVRKAASLNPEAPRLMLDLLKKECKALGKMSSVDKRHFPEFVVDFTYQAQPSLITQYVSHSLEEKVGKITSNETLGYFVQILDGLSSLHGEGIVLADIKPSQFRIDEKGDVKIVDLNMKYANPKDLGDTCSIMHSAAFSLMDSPQKVQGTPRYMAPEQWNLMEGKKEAKIDERTDIFQAGSLLYEMLTGNQPQGKFEDLKDINPCLASLDAVVHKAFARDPAKRYQSVREFKEDLFAKLNLSEEEKAKLIGEETKIEVPKIIGAPLSPVDYWRKRGEETQELLTQFYRQNKEVLSGRSFHFFPDGRNEKSISFGVKDIVDLGMFTLHEDQRANIKLRDNNISVELKRQYLNTSGNSWKWATEEEFFVLGQGLGKPGKPIFETERAMRRYEEKSRKYDERKKELLKGNVVLAGARDLPGLYVYAAHDRGRLEYLKQHDSFLRDLPRQITAKINSGDFSLVG